MTPSEKTFAQILQIEGAQEHYVIPRYQRPYTWRKDNWEQLLGDLLDETHQFLGSLICVIKDSGDAPGAGEERYFEVIDGQQRLTTLSLLVCAIYKKLKDFEPPQGMDEQTENWQATRRSLRLKLIRNKAKKEVSGFDDPVEKDDTSAKLLRLSPASQGNNREDYLHALRDAGVLKVAPAPQHWGIRRIALAYRYFLEKSPSTIPELTKLIDKINSVKFVHISVESQADAYRLFETLNNRGVPLTALDIIKSHLLATLERSNRGSIDTAYEKWKEITDRLTEDQETHERYLRHFFHAFKHLPAYSVKGFTRATRSSLIPIYEGLIKKDAQGLLAKLDEQAVHYQPLVEPSSASRAPRRKLLTTLNRAGAVASHQFLLYLFDLESRKLVSADMVDDTIAFLIRYFVRRNICDQPATNRMDALFIGLIDKCHEKKGKIDHAFIRRYLKTHADKPATNDYFAENLTDNLWYYNDGMARFVLCYLDETFSNREYTPDLWRRDEKGKLVWTIEHVLPQNRRLKKEWVAMIADGDPDVAVTYQDDWVDCLGNLTLSAYNSKLHDAPFPAKQAKQEVTAAGDPVDIGYQNGLALNAKITFSIEGKATSLAKTTKWTVKEIEARNSAIVARAMKLFSLD